MKPRIHPRISLLTSLLLVTIAGMALVIVQLWREMQPLHRELETLRAEFGILGIDDDRKMHAILVKQPVGFQWTWRIWLPKGHDYWFCASKKVPPKGITTRQYRNFIGTGGQEITIRVGVAPSEEGTRWVYLQSGTHHSPFFEVENTKWLNGEIMIGEDVAGATSQLSSNVDDPLVLLRLEEDSRSSGKQPPDGLLIWISNQQKP